jgi:hypothetical protein
MKNIHVYATIDLVLLLVLIAGASTAELGRQVSRGNNRLLQHFCTVCKAQLHVHMLHQTSDVPASYDMPVSLLLLLLLLLNLRCTVMTLLLPAGSSRISSSS